MRKLVHEKEYEAQPTKDKIAAKQAEQMQEQGMSKVACVFCDLPFDLDLSNLLDPTASAGAIQSPWRKDSKMGCRLLRDHRWQEMHDSAGSG
jgi:hypothetical protein